MSLSCLVCSLLDVCVRYVLVIISLFGKCVCYALRLAHVFANVFVMLRFCSLLGGCLC